MFKSKNGKQNLSDSFDSTCKDDALQEAILSSINEQNTLLLKNFKNLPESGFRPTGLNFYFLIFF